MREALLDTDILTEVLKRKDPQVAAHGAVYFAAHGVFTLSAVTRFELLRGFKEKGAAAQVTRFEAFCARSKVLPVTDAVLDRAIDLWVAGRHGGHPCQDADLLIAATALEHNLTLVTGNTAHFAWVPGLTLADWRTP
jgi:tRNA(fMet)-specific endonuclease VapC